jgi:hypothetical protein
MGALLRGLFDIRAGELQRVAWLTLHSLCLGLFVAIFFAAANGLFLASYTVKNLPMAWISASLVGYAVVLLHTAAARRLSGATLAIVNVGLLLAVMIAFCVAARAGAGRGLAFAMFVWIVPSGTLLSLQHSRLLASLFDLRQGKRLFSMLGAGEVVSSILGYLLVPLLFGLFADPMILIPVAAGGLIGCLLVTRAMARRYPANLAGRPAAAGGGRDAAERGGTGTGPARPGAGAGKAAAAAAGATRPERRYVAGIALLAACLVLAGTFVDFLFLGQIQLRFPGPEQVARFIGIFFAVVRIVELLLKLFLAGRLVGQFGLGFGLGALPVALLLTVAAAAAAGLGLGVAHSLFFLFVALAKLVFLSLRRAFFDPVLKVLFQCLPRPRQLAAQARIEGSIQQLAAGVAGLLLLGILRRGAVPPPYLAAALAPLALGAAVLAGRIHRGYRTQLVANVRERVQAGAAAGAAGQPLAEPPQDGAVAIAMAVVAGGARPAVLPEPAAEPAGPTREISRIVEGLWLPTSRDAAEDGAVAAGEIVLGPLEVAFARAGHALPVRLSILHIYGRIATPAAMALLAEKVRSGEPAIWREALGLLRRGEVRATPAQAAGLRGRVEQIVENSAWNLAALLDLDADPRAAAVAAGVRAQLRRDRDDLCTLLSLLYDSRAIGLVRELLEGADKEAGVYALEVAEVVIGPELRPLVVPLLEDLPPARRLRSLAGLFPQQPMALAARLEAIVHRDYARMSTDARVQALQALGAVHDGGKPSEMLVASLFHTHPALREAAARVLLRIDRECYAACAERLPAETREELDRLLAWGGGDRPDASQPFAVGLAQAA